VRLEERHLRAVAELLGELLQQLETAFRSFCVYLNRSELLRVRLEY